MTSNVSMVVVFLEGMASFLSPCILPLMPVYLSYLTGGSLEEIEAGDKNLRRITIINSIGFLLGLTIVFVALGATATTIGRFLYFNSNIIRKIGGIIIIIFGLHHMGILNIKLLSREKRISFSGDSPKFINAVLLGMAFSFGWTPCIGPILGSVLMMAASMKTLISGIYLLIIYSIGFSIPFLITAVFFSWILKRFDNIEKHLKTVKIISGVLLVIMGILVYTNYVYRISSLLTR